MSLIIAHRGYSAKFRENSPSAWREAVMAGADVVEVDVRFTADGQCVCLHDPDLRLAGSDALIGQVEFADIASLTPGGEPVAPLLSEAFGAIAASTPILLDVKDERPEALDTLSSLVRSFGMRRVILGLHTLAAVVTMAQNGHEDILGLLSGPEAEDDAFFQSGGTILRLWESRIAQSRVERLLGGGRSIWVTTGGNGTGRDVGDFDAMRLVSMRDAGIAGFLVNDPVLARSALEEARLPKST